MKRILALGFAIFIALGLFAQNEFTVPERKLENQVERTKSMMHYQTVCTIAFAKANGKSMKETGTFFGDLYKTTWNNVEGFNSFVKWTIFNLNDFSDKVEILSQSPEKVVLKVVGLTKALGEQKALYGVSEKEYIEFFQYAHNQIAEYMGTSIQFSLKDNWLEVVMKDK